MQHTFLFFHFIYQNKMPKMPKAKPCSVCDQWWDFMRSCIRGEVRCDFSLYIFITASKIYGTRLSIFNSKFLSNYNLFVTEVITNTYYIPCRNPDKHSKKSLERWNHPSSHTQKTFLLKCWWLFFRAFSSHATSLLKESTHQDNCMWGPGS